MYKLSKDYEKLFQLICEGHIAAGFADYARSYDQENKCRDICSIQRNQSFNIVMGVRGMTYGFVYPFMAEEGSELELFCKECNAIRLEWIETAAA